MFGAHQHRLATFKKQLHVGTTASRAPPSLHEWPRPSAPRNATAHTTIEQEHAWLPAEMASGTQTKWAVVLVTQIDFDGVLERRRRCGRAQLPGPRCLALALLPRRAPRDEHCALLGATTTVDLGDENPLGPETLADSMRRCASPIITSGALPKKSQLLIDAVGLSLRPSQLCHQAAISLSREFTQLASSDSV